MFEEENVVAVEEIETVIGRGTKKEGAKFDGSECYIPKNIAVQCIRCRKNDSFGYAKRFGKSVNNNYACVDCSNFFPKCFICQKMFESAVDLTDVPETQRECKSCSEQ